MKRTVGLVCLLFIMFLFQCDCPAQGGPPGIRSWLCFYGAGFPAASPPRYDLYVFQPGGHPDLKPLKDQGSRTVGYISAGEINKNEPYFEKISGEGLLLEESRQWPGSFRVDIRNERWREFIIKELIPQLLSQGFDGVFIDTIDTAQYLEDEKGLSGSIDKAVALIREIRKQYPSILIVLNNGLFLLDDAGSSIDALAVEDVFTQYDFKKRRYQPATAEWTRERTARLKQFQERFHKPVLSLDYVKASDHKRINEVSRRAVENGFVPYIAEIGLNRIFFHP